MLQEALQKLQKEIGDYPKDDYVRYVGAELIKYVRSNPDLAGLFAAGDKTIKGSHAELEKEATTSKRKFIAPDEGKALILKYFGVQVPEAVPEVIPVSEPQITVSLDDLF